MTTLRDPLTKRLARSAYRLGLGVEVLARSGERAGKPRLFYGGTRPGNSGGALVKMQRLVEYFPEDRKHYNLVYLMSNTPYLPPFALETLKRRGVPIVLNQNGVFYGGWFAGDWQAKNREMAVAYHAADHVFWQSTFCRRSADRFLGERDGAGEVLFNAVDTDHFTPAIERPERPLTFLVAGKIDHHLFYRIDSSLRGFAEARRRGLDAAMIIAGMLDNRAEEMTRALIDDLRVGDRVTLAGAYRQADAPSVYRKADIYVMTKHNDPCPNTVLEAMASGLPVIYSATGGVPELVGEEAGIGLACAESWDEPHWPDVDALAEAMLRAADARETMAVAARERAVERFGIDHWIARHRAVFESLLETRA